MLEIVDMGPAFFYLGNHITCDCSHCKLWLSQKSYCVELLCIWNLSHCATTSISMIVKPYLLDPASNALPDVADDNIKPLFQKLVSLLIYLEICTHLDISYTAMSLG
jgi:hypothetical protein